MENFIFIIEDVFRISGMGVVVTGCVKSGEISVGDTIYVEKNDGTFETVQVGVIEKFRKKENSAKKGDYCGLSLGKIKSNEIKRGGIVTNSDKDKNNIALDGQSTKVTEIINPNELKKNNKNKKWWQKLV